MIKQSTYDIIHGNNSVKKEKEGEDMNLLYKSTRNSEKKVTASEAILKGLRAGADSDTGCDNGRTQKHDVSGDCIRSDETVSDRLYRGGVKALHR